MSLLYMLSARVVTFVYVSEMPMAQLNYDLTRCHSPRCLIASFQGIIGQQLDHTILIKFVLCCQQSVSE